MGTVCGFMKLILRGKEALQDFVQTDFRSLLRASSTILTGLSRKPCLWSAEVSMEGQMKRSWPARIKEFLPITFASIIKECTSLATVHR